MRYVEEFLRQERGELTRLDKEVARSLAEGITVTENIEETAMRTAHWAAAGSS